MKEDNKLERRNVHHDNHIITVMLNKWREVFHKEENERRSALKKQGD